jgi:hypothetical protein
VEPIEPIPKPSRGRPRKASSEPKSTEGPVKELVKEEKAKDQMGTDSVVKRGRGRPKKVP